VSGQKIIGGLRDAVAGNLARVTVDGCTWVRKEDLDRLRAEVAEWRQAARVEAKASVTNSVVRLERLRPVIKGAEIAIARDEDSAAAAQILIAAQAEEVREA
jgi:hypothetical protein